MPAEPAGPPSGITEPVPPVVGMVPVPLAPPVPLVLLPPLPSFPTALPGVDPPALQPIGVGRFGPRRMPAASQARKWVFLVIVRTLTEGKLDSGECTAPPFRSPFPRAKTRWTGAYAGKLQLGRPGFQR